MKNEIIGIGTYTEYVANAPGACGDGILTFSLNCTNGELTKIDQFKIFNPSYISWSKKDRKLYSSNEKKDGTGKINSFYIDENYKIKHLNETDDLGSAFCFITKPDENGTLFVASYSDGLIFKITHKHNEFKINYKHKYIGSGPNLQRQEAPHAHQVVRDPEHKKIYICDLGSDKIWIDDLDSDKPTSNRFLEIPEGYGPRHLIFSDCAEYIYILCELEPRLLVAKVNKRNGSLTLINDYPSTHLIDNKKAAPAAIKLHPSGKTLAVSNRVINTISIFKILDNHLLFLEEFSSRGDHPRDINFTEEGDWLLIANQDSNDIQIKAFDKNTGEPKERWAKPYKIGTPTCIINLGTID